MNFGHPEPTSQGQSLALEPIFLRANGGLHRANSSKLALQRASWQHWFDFTISTYLDLINSHAILDK